MSEISSGLVAEFWLSIDCIGERYLCFSKPQDDDELHPLVRLSDAEAIISAKDAEIERLKESVAAFKQMMFTNTDRSMTLDDRFFTAHEGGFVSDNNFDFDAGLQVSGDFVNNEKDRYAQMIACTLNNYSKQSAALKLARDAFLSVCGCYPLHYSTKPGFREANEALAAINEVLKGE